MFIIKTQTKIAMAAAGLIIVLAMACFTLFNLWQSEKAERKQMGENIRALVEGMRTNADSSQAQVKVITTQLRDLKNEFPDLKAELKSHGIKLKNIEQYQQSILGVNANFTADIKQQITNRDTTIVSQYADKWLQFIAKQRPSDTTSAVNIKMDVDLSQVVNRQRPPGFWGFLKKRELVQDLWTENPYVKLKYNRIIKVK